MISLRSYKPSIPYSLALAEEDSSPKADMVQTLEESLGEKLGWRTLSW